MDTATAAQVHFALPTDHSQAERHKHAATHVEFTFRDAYLTRADMRRMAASISLNKALYKGQELEFLGTRMTVKTLYIRGQEVDTAFFSDTTKPIFRSESARFFIYIQLSREMWEFETTGSGAVLFDTLVQKFLPDLFKRWADLRVRHLISIVLFTRMEYTTEPFERQPIDSSLSSSPTVRDFYRVVVSYMPSTDSLAILDQLKREFRVFLKHVSIRSTTFHWDGTPCAEPHDIISGKPSLAKHGNILEAINLTTAHNSQDNIDRDLTRTGLSVMVISPGTGAFEVDENMLRLTTENLVANGIGIDLVCLSPRALHYVPVFQYRPARFQAQTILQPNSSTLPSHGFASPRSTSSNTMRTPQFSPPEPSVGSRPGQPHPSVLNLKEGLFAVPHWLETHHYLDPNDPEHYNPNVFKPTVRMYEVMMGGVMESQRQISIPYMYETHPQYTGVGTGRPALNQDDDLSWMEEHDEAIFRLPQAPGSKDAGSTRRSPIRQSKHGPSRTDGNAFFSSHSFRHSAVSPNSDIIPQARLQPQSQMTSIHEHATQRQTQDNSGRSMITRGGKTFEAQPRGSRDNTEPEMTSIHKNEPRRQFLDRNERTTVTRGGKTFEAQSSGSRDDNMVTRGNQALDRAERKRVLSSAPQLQPKASRESVVSVKGGRRPLILGNRGVSLSKATATTAGTYEPFDPTKPPTGSIPVAKDPGNNVAATIQADPEPSFARPPLVQRVSTASQPGHPSGPVTICHTRNIDTEMGRINREIHQYRGVASPPKVWTSPWLTLVDPFKQENAFNAAKDNRRWNHLQFNPDAPVTSFMNWKSLLTPAALPLTLSYFPTGAEFNDEYEEGSHKIAVDVSDAESVSLSRANLMRDLIDLRLSKGFQIVLQSQSNLYGHRTTTAGHLVASGSLRILDHNTMAEQGTTVFMSKGDLIHILCAAEKEVQVTRLRRKVQYGGMPQTGVSIDYKPFIRTAFATQYEQQRLNFSVLRDEHNWSAIDQYLAGWDRDVYSFQLQCWSARFVLIPVDTKALKEPRPAQIKSGDLEDEIHIEGVQKITQIWERFRLKDGERPATVDMKILDPNPLSLEFHTMDASVVITAGLFEDAQFFGSDRIRSSTRIFSNLYTFKASDIKNDTVDLQKLAHALQGDEGIKIKDRHWFFKVHANCFVAADLVSWLLHNVKDVTTRDEAVILGQDLMDKGMVVHVEHKHAFRDGNYFFAISSEYHDRKGDSLSAWFSRKPENVSVTSTTATDLVKEHHTPDKSLDKESESYVPEKAADTRPTKVKLSAVLDYDLDGRNKNSSRPEVIKLHYDRIYNPEGCYHFRLEWLDANPKLIEDAITSWSREAERYGLKLVQVPIPEMRTISDSNPFRSPYVVKISVPPPADTEPDPEEEELSSSAQNAPRGHHGYQRALLRRCGFLLDTETASNFPSDIEVAHSWGNPSYNLSQYIHRSGAVMSQVNERGDLMFVANRLAGARAGTFRTRASQTVNPNEIVSEVEAICSDQEGLRRFWAEVAGRDEGVGQ